jgi:hypothetical protein
MKIMILKNHYKNNLKIRIRIEKPPIQNRIVISPADQPQQPHRAILLPPQTAELV